MKYATATLLLMVSLGSLSITAGEPQTTTVEAPITKVTVYPGQAKITRMAGLDLEAGEHTIVIERLPGDVNPETFTVSASGVDGATILGLRPRRVQHLEPPREELAKVEREVRRLEQEERRVVMDHLAAFKQQKELLKKLAETAGSEMGKQVTGGSLDISQWNAAYDFIGSKAIQTDDSIRQAQFALKDIEDRRSLLLDQQYDLNSRKRLKSTSVAIDLRLERAGKLEMDLDYVVDGANWEPLYDARLDPETDTVEISYFADIYQKTGEDWNDVELTLSTSQPSQGTGPGLLPPQWLRGPAPGTSSNLLSEVGGVQGKSRIIDRFETSPQSSLSQAEIEPRPVQAVDALLEQVAGVQTNATGEVFVSGTPAGEVVYQADGVPTGDALGGSSPAGLASGRVMNSSTYNTNFRIMRKETIRSDNQQVRAPIAQYRFGATPRFLCRPLLRQEVYRVASVVNQSDAPLMSGSMSIFVGSNYIGRTHKGGLTIPREKFTIPFGPDNSVKASRKIVQHKRTLSSTKVRQDQTIEITLTNHALEPKEVRLEETLPVSQDNRIKVDIRDKRPDTDDPDGHGMLRWRLTLQPGEETTVSFSYRIEYPRGIPVKGL